MIGTTEKITVNVTQVDILNGKRGFCRHCPIALAIIRATGDEAYVSWSDAEINGVNYALPQVACDFITRFDRQIGNVQPFTFEIELASA